MEALPQLLADIVDPNLESIVAKYDENPEEWARNVRTKLLYPVLPEAALRAARAIEKQAAESDRRPQEFATTIVIAVSRRVSERWFTASFTVGDGGVALFDADAAQVDVLCRPDSGEFAGQTRFLATGEFRDGEDVLERIFVDIRDRFTVLAAMTDGITDPKFPTDAVFAKPQSWIAFWQDDLCRQVGLHSDNQGLREEMLAWLDFWSRGNHDDRTIALMLPSPKNSSARYADAAPQEMRVDTWDTQASEGGVVEQTGDTRAGGA